MGGIIGGKPSNAAAERRAKIQQEQQEAQQKRDALNEGEREEELDKQRAASRRKVLAKRSGRSALAFSGPATKLKSTLGE